MRCRWLLLAVLLLTLVVALGATPGQRPRRQRFSRLNRKAHTVAGQVKRNQLKQRRREEAVNNEVTAIAKAGSRAKDKPPQRGRGTKARGRLVKSGLQKKSGRRPKKPARGRNPCKGKARRRRATAKEACLFRALSRCSKRIKRLPDMHAFAKRCQAKEKFLDCMSKSQRRGCKKKPKKKRRRGPPRCLIKQRQRRLQRLLVHARGCVIGVDLSAATTPVTSR